MSLSINTATIGGNLTRDVELKTIPNGKNVAKFAIAINDRYKAADGTMKESVTYVDIEAWGATADVAAKYLKRGSPAVVEGRLKSESWETKDGQKRQRLMLKAERLHLIGGRPDAAPEQEPKPTKVAMPVQGADDEASPF